MPVIVEGEALKSMLEIGGPPKTGWIRARGWSGGWKKPADGMWFRVLDVQSITLHHPTIIVFLPKEYWPWDERKCYVAVSLDKFDGYSYEDPTQT